MRTPTSLRALCLAVCLGLVGCGSHEDAAPSSPTAPQLAPSAGVSRSASDPIAMAASSPGLAPEGFRTVIRVDPKPDVDGVIRGDSPLTVTFDACGSTADAGKTLHFLFDWNFDDVADVVGTGDACRQTHKYNVKAAADGKGEAILETNVCVVNANPGAHAPGTYYSCRTYRVGLPRNRACGANEVSFGGKCYYLDGSGGQCDPGFSLAPQGVLSDIAARFEGLNYKHTVSDNCCIWNSDADEDWGMNYDDENGSCNIPGPFRSGEPRLDGAGCTDLDIREPNQLTLCGSN